MPSTAKFIVTVLLSAALGAGGYALYGKRMTGAGAPAPAGPPASAGQGERRILYWYDPMVPQQHFDKPGKSPYMDMQLMPKYADEGTAPDTGGVSIDARVIQNMGVRLAAAEKGPLAGELDALGIVRLDETRTRVVQSRVAGYVEHQPVRSVNQPVARGQVLLELTSPELIASQHELLLALKANDAALAAAARERLRLAGMAQGQIERVERSGEVMQRVAVTAPEPGIVTELNARPGMTVAAGAPLMTLASLATVWVVADIPERDAASVVPGRGAEVRFAALPGEVLEGKVDYVYPEIAGAARTLRARIPLANAHGQLKPGMLASISFRDRARSERVLVPSEAVIETGTRSVVIVNRAPGKFAAIDVKLGHEREGKTEVLEGVEAGQKVVVSGQFLIDSEASLGSALARLEGAAAAPAAAPPLALGKVNAVDAKAATINLSHGPVSSVAMPGMTMEFKVDPPALLKGIAPGQSVEFDLEKRGNDYVVTRLKRKK